MAGIHDVTLEYKLVPISKRKNGFDEWKKDNRAFKLFQSRWYEKDEKKRGVSSAARPNLLDLPIHTDEIPYAFKMKEGRSFGPLHVWPKTADEPTKPYKIYYQDKDRVVQIEESKGVQCTGKAECFIFLNRGYYCAKHLPTSVDN